MQKLLKIYKTSNFLIVSHRNSVPITCNYTDMTVILFDSDYYYYYLIECHKCKIKIKNSRNDVKIIVHVIVKIKLY